MRARRLCVYFLANRMRGTLYIGVTFDLIQRIWRHRNDQTDGFTHKYGVHTPVWYELHDSMESAIQREKTVKAWKCAWKLDSIETSNPDWHDLYPEIL